MNELGKLSRVLKLREHRSLIAQQLVQTKRQAMIEAEAFLSQQETELQRRIQSLAQSERSAAKILQAGGSGVRFEDFVAHARLVHGRIQDQRGEVQAAHTSIAEAAQRLDEAKSQHALARKAEEKTKHFKDNTRTLVRLRINSREAEQLEEVSELQYKPQETKTRTEEAAT
jgi:hypothetical protein